MNDNDYSDYSDSDFNSDIEERNNDSDSGQEDCHRCDECRAKNRHKKENKETYDILITTCENSEIEKAKELIQKPENKNLELSEIFKAACKGGSVELVRFIYDKLSDNLRKSVLLENSLPIVCEYGREELFYEFFQPFIYDRIKHKDHDLDIDNNEQPMILDLVPSFYAALSKNVTGIAKSLYLSHNFGVVDLFEYACSKDNIIVIRMLIESYFHLFLLREDIEIWKRNCKKMIGGLYNLSSPKLLELYHAARCILPSDDKLYESYDVFLKIINIEFLDRLQFKYTFFTEFYTMTIRENVTTIKDLVSIIYSYVSLYEKEDDTHKHFPNDLGLIYSWIKRKKGKEYDDD